MGVREEREEGRLQWRKYSSGFGYIWQVHASSFYLIISWSSFVSDLTSTETVCTIPTLNGSVQTALFLTALQPGVRVFASRKKNRWMCSWDSPDCMHTCVFNFFGVLPGVSIEWWSSRIINLEGLIPSPFTFCRFSFPESSQLFFLCVGRRFHLLVPPLKSLFAWSPHSFLSICHGLVST